jgi:DNA-binding protein H-NS
VIKAESPASKTKAMIEAEALQERYIERRQDSGAAPVSKAVIEAQESQEKFIEQKQKSPSAPTERLNSPPAQ